MDKVFSLQNLLDILLVGVYGGAITFLVGFATNRK